MKQLDTPTPNLSPSLAQERVFSTELWISFLLRAGVGLSLILILAGTALSFIHHPEYFTQRKSLAPLVQQDATFAHTLPNLWADLKHDKGQAIVTLGLLALIATPILRVAVSTLIFWHEHDRIFTCITLAVLMLLLISLFLGHAGG